MLKLVQRVRLRRALLYVSTALVWEVNFLAFVSDGVLGEEREIAVNFVKDARAGFVTLLFPLSNRQKDTVRRPRFDGEDVSNAKEHRMAVDVVQYYRKCAYELRMMDSAVGGDSREVIVPRDEANVCE